MPNLTTSERVDLLMQCSTAAEMRRVIEAVPDISQGPSAYDDTYEQSRNAPGAEVIARTGIETVMEDSFGATTILFGASQGNSLTDTGWLIDGVSSGEEGFDFSRPNIPSYGITSGSFVECANTTITPWDETGGMSFGGIVQVKSGTNVLFTMAGPSGQQLFAVFATTVTVGSQNRLKFRMLIDDVGGTEVVDVTTSDIHAIREVPFMLTGHWDQSVGRVRLWIDGKLVVDETHSPTTISFDSVAFSSVYRSGVSAAILSTRWNSAFIGAGAVTDDDVEALMTAWLGEIVDLTYPNILSHYSQLTLDKFYKVRVRLGQDSLLAVGVGAELDTSASVRMQLSHDQSVTTTISDGQIYGQYSGAQYYIDGSHDADQVKTPAGVVPVGFWVSSESGGFEPKAFSVIPSAGDQPFVGEVKDGHSFPRACVYDGNVFTAHAGIYLDRRYIGKHAKGQVSEYLLVDDGFTFGDVNHAGNAIIATNAGVLIVETGHGDPYARCTYFADGDLSSPSTYTIGGATSGFSYPQLVLLDSGDVAMYWRGSIDEGAVTAHSGVLAIFDPTDGSGLTTDVLFSTGASSGYRAYNTAIQHETVGGTEYLFFCLNPRGWSSDVHETIAVVGYNVTNDVWIAPDGSAVGTAGVKGTAASPRADNDEWITPVADGGWVIAVRGDYETIECDTQSCVFQTSALPEIKGTVCFSRTNGEAAGGYSDSKISIIDFEGTSITERAELETPFGRPNTPFYGATMWNDAGNTYLMVLHRGQKDFSGIGSEVSSPYWHAWRGGEHAFVYEIGSSTETLIASRRLGALPVADVLAVDSAPGVFSGIANLEKTHATLGRCEVRFINGSTGRIAADYWRL